MSRRHSGPDGPAHGGPLHGGSPHGRSHGGFGGHGHGRGRHWGPNERPPWWPDGEPWPPRGSGHALGVAARRRFRRRLLVFGVLAVLALVLVAAVVGLATGGWDGPGPGEPGGEGPGEDGPPPGGPLFVLGVIALIAGTATAVTYRRLRGPVGELMGAAGQVAEGDYAIDLDVPRRGPRELRILTGTFNQMAARLALNEEQRRRFLADVTHELRTPLTVLQSGIEAQLDGVHPRDDQHLSSLLEETQRLGHLVNDLHTLALAEAGRLVIQHEGSSAAVLVDEAVERHEAGAAQRGVELGRVVAPGLPEIEVDPARIRQVLDNLLANAVRHTPSGGEVRIEVDLVTGRPTGADGEGPPRGDPSSAETTAGAVRFAVIDTGPGFRQDQLEHLFERFTSAGDTRGSGLGLSIARDLVEAHGGAIEAGNDPSSGGARVSFIVPV